MRRVRRTLPALAVCLFVLGIGVAEASKRVAVLPLTNGAGLETSHVILLTDAVRQQGITALPNQFQMMTQDNMMAFLPPGKTLADCIGQCAVETGKKLKAHYVVTGQVERLGDSMRIVLSVHATKSGRFLETVELSGPTVLSLEAEIRRRGGAAFSAIRKDTEGSRFALGGLGGVVGDSVAPKRQEMALPARSEEFVRFESVPPGITVRLDEKPLCTTPCQRAVQYGPHVIEFRSRCHHPELRRVRLSKEKETVKFDVRPKPISKTTPLSVETSSGERTLVVVSVNGRVNAKAETPSEVQLDLSTCVTDGARAESASAKYEVRVAAQGYVPQTLKMAAGTRAQDVTIKKMPVLNVDCGESGAPIFIDGKTSARSPHQFNDLLPKRYVVACGRPDWPSSQQIVSLVADETENIVLEVPKVAKVDLECDGGAVRDVRINGRVLKPNMKTIQGARRRLTSQCKRRLRKAGVSRRGRKAKKAYKTQFSKCLEEMNEGLHTRDKGIAQLKVEREKSAKVRLDILPGRYTFACKGKASSDTEVLDIRPGGSYQVALDKPATPRHFGLNVAIEGGGGIFPAQPMAETFSHDEGIHSVAMTNDTVGVGTIELLVGIHLLQVLSLNFSVLTAISDSDSIRYMPEGPGYDADYYFFGAGMVAEMYLMPHRSPSPFISAGYFSGRYTLMLDRVTDRAGTEETDHTEIDSTTEEAQLLRFKAGIHWKADNYPKLSPGVRLGVAMMSETDLSQRTWGGFFGIDF
jgi:TolB-like protein